MYIKIYFDDKPLFICNQVEPAIEPYLHHDDAVFIDEFSNPAVNSMLHEMRQPNVHAGIIEHADVEQVKKAIWKKFTIVKAGGGVVRNGDGKALFIFRREKWDLPKGKLDPGETIEACASREIMEETGLKELNLVGPLTTTYHTYHESGKFIMKESYWFRFTTTDNSKLLPQAEEQIAEATWLGDSELEKVYVNTYPLIIDVLEAEGR